MANETETETGATAPKNAPKTERKAVASTTWYKTDGKEAESPLDSVGSVTFKLDELGDSHQGWTLDFADLRDSGIDEKRLNTLVAFAGFGFKTKLTNEASSIRNDPKIKGTDAASWEAQAAALDEFLTELESGNWRAARGEGESVAGVDDLAQAIANIQKARGKTPDVEQIKTKLKAMDKDKRAEQRKAPQVQAELAAIRLARLQAKAGTKVEGAATEEDLLNL